MSDETVGDECVRRVPLPATRFYDAMRAGHRARVGHELRAYLVCAGGGIHDIVRRCCGESDAGHDHTLCCGPGSPWAARQYLTRCGGTHAWRWLREMNPRDGAGWVELFNGSDSRGMADAILCERPAVNAVALRWDHNQRGRVTS